MFYQAFIRQWAYAFLTTVAVFLMSGFPDAQAQNNQSDWTAPDWADTLTNPLKGQKAAVKKGKVLFTSICKTCHGPKGRGNGPQAEALNKQPANLPSPEVQQQTDGALFWKISEGNSPMLSFRNSLSKKQRWQVINYIRKLGDKYGSKPTAKKDAESQTPESPDDQGQSAAPSEKGESSTEAKKASQTTETAKEAKATTKSNASNNEKPNANGKQNSQASKPGKASKNASGQESQASQKASGTASGSGVSKTTYQEADVTPKNTVMGVSLGMLLFSGMITLLIVILGLAIAFLNVLK